MSAAPFFDEEDIADFREKDESNMLPALIYRLKPVGIGAGFRSKSSQVWPTDYALFKTTLGSFHTNLARGREYQVGGQTRSQGDWIVDLQWDAGATQEDKVTIDGRTFNLISERTSQYKETQKFDANEIR